MKISEEILNEGRAYINNTDLDGFLSWVKTNAPTLSLSVVKDTYSVIFRLKDTERGLKLFNKVFPEYDIAEEKIRAFVVKGIFMIVFFGA